MKSWRDIAIWMLATLILLMGGLGTAAAFETPVYYAHSTEKEAEFNAGQFGLLNATGTTEAFKLDRMYSAFFCEFTRIGTSDIVMHLQASKYGLAFVNITGTSGHTVDDTADNLGLAVPARGGHKGQHIRIVVGSGASATEALTNSICAGGTR
ncbi:MAG: hypothetical protein KAR06_11775 [Deltaproteobacteria bacterium]|nr:hypothetical protein [Deltaproteobacteria bacterium]